MKLAVLTILSLALASAPARALTLLDDFSGASLSPSWTVLSGTWDASGGTLSQTDATTFFPHALEWNATTPGADFSFQVDVMLPPGIGNVGNNAVGIAFRIQDANDYYRMHFFPAFSNPRGAFRFEKVVNGLETADSTPDLDMGFIPALGSYYTIRVDGRGSTYTASIANGVGDSGWDYTFTATDTTFSGGGIGLTNAGGPGMFQRVEADFSMPEPASLALLALAGPLAALRRARRRGR